MRTDQAGVQWIGFLWLIYGCLRIAGFAFLLIYSNTLKLMWGALLTRVPSPLAWMSFFHVMLAVVLVWCVICAILAFAAGVAILRGARSTRNVTLAAALVSLPEWPFGIVLGVYTLIMLMPVAPARPQAVQSSTPPRPLVMRESR